MLMCLISEDREASAAEGLVCGGEHGGGLGDEASADESEGFRSEASLESESTSIFSSVVTAGVFGVTGGVVVDTFCAVLPLSAVSCGKQKMQSCF